MSAMGIRPVDGTEIVERAKALGASLAGLVPLSALRELTQDLLKGWEGEAARASILVLALEHPDSEPALDWWGGTGGTEGNRRLIAVSDEIRRSLGQASGIAARPLPYHPWKGGVLLKDAAVVAGLGCIGANNLLITPQYGARVRLRALLLDLAAEPAPALAFDPCRACAHPCWQACPRQAFASGAYQKAACAVQMELDERRAAVRAKAKGGSALVSYCRACEWACPVGG
jgi:epoxyqueuosine reductase